MINNRIDAWKTDVNLLNSACRQDGEIEFQMKFVEGLSEPLRILQKTTYRYTLRVKRSTARSIVANYLREGRVNERPRGGRKRKVNNILKGYLTARRVVDVSRLLSEGARRNPGGGGTPIYELYRYVSL